MLPCFTSCMAHQPGGTKNEAGTQIAGTGSLNIDDRDEKGNPGDATKAAESMLDAMRPLLKGSTAENKKTKRGKGGAGGGGNGKEKSEARKNSFLPAHEHMCSHHVIRKTS